MKRNQITNPRKLELLKKYYEVEEENKIVRLSFHYEEAKDMLYTDVGDVNHPQLSPDVSSKLNELIPSLPLGYKIAVNFHINDYQGYDPNTLLETFNDSLEWGQYVYAKKRKRTWLNAILMVVVGLLLLLLYVFGDNYGWFGSGLQSDIITEVIDIIGTVFIWEAVTMVFIEHTDDSILGLRIRRRVSSIGFYEGESDHSLVVENSSDVFKKWDEGGGVNRFASWSTLLSSAALIGMAFSNIFVIYSVFKNFDLSLAQSIVFMVLATLETICQFIAGAGGLCKYSGLDNKFTRFVGPYSFVLLGVIIAMIVTSIVISSPRIIVNSVFSLIINVFYIIGYLIDRFAK